ncbi:MAG: hypothetical protein ACLGPL_00030, partial [Acidobacteriota bacterium]
ILHAVRGVVTSADNILDREDKGAVKLELGEGRTLRNIMLILLQNGLIHQVLQDLAPEDARLRQRAWSVLIEGLFSIANEESAEEEDVETVLSPEEILRSIHSFRGGKLLQLAFMVPKVFEAHLGDRFEAAMAGIYSIGLALQILDDVTDLAEDVQNRNHNVLRSWIVHHGPDGAIPDSDLKARSEAALKSPETTFPKATAQVVSLALRHAIHGFDRLRDIGYPVDHASSLELIRMLFRLRGLARLWDFWRENGTEPPHMAEFLEQSAC